MMPERPLPLSPACLVAAIVSALLLLAGAAPARAAGGLPLGCSFELNGTVKPGFKLLPDYKGTFRASGPIRCTGGAPGADVPDGLEGTMTVKGKIGPRAITAVTGAGCFGGSYTAKARIVWPNGARVSGRLVLPFAVFDGVITGTLGGTPVVGQLGIAWKPDTNYGRCRPDEPIDEFLVTGRGLQARAPDVASLLKGLGGLALPGLRAGGRVDHAHAVTAFQYLPSGTLNVAVLGPNPILAAYPVRRGDTITFTNLDTHPHSVTACRLPCNTWIPEKTGAFDGEILQLGEQYTVDTERLEPGTYSYFCKAHPFMRGAVRVNKR